MMLSDPRANIERLCREHGETFASLSKWLGKNPAYIQQFVRRGVPERLKEEDRRKLAEYFGVPQSMFGGPPEFDAPLVPVFTMPLQVSAGPGSEAGDRVKLPYFAFDRGWLRRLTQSHPDDLSIVQVKGDSMSPTLNDGDDLLVDHADSGERLRDGIYVIRAEDDLFVKRIAINPMRRTITVQSDNPAYPDWPDCDLTLINFIGRVIWSGRKLV